MIQSHFHKYALYRKREKNTTFYKEMYVSSKRGSKYSATENHGIYLKCANATFLYRPASHPDAHPRPMGEGRTLKKE